MQSSMHLCVHDRATHAGSAGGTGLRIDGLLVAASHPNSTRSVFGVQQSSWMHPRAVGVDVRRRVLPRKRRTANLIVTPDVLISLLANLG